MSGLGYGGRRRSTRRKSRRGGAKRDEKAHRKMEDATRHGTMSRFVRGAPVHHRPAAALLSARRPENERALSAYQLSRLPIGMPKIMIVPRGAPPRGPAESAPGSPNLPEQNPPPRSPGPAIMRVPRNNPSPARSAPPSPRNGGRSRKTRRNRK